MICFLNAIFVNIRYFFLFAAKGYVASGHRYKPIGVHDDHWDLKCTSCNNVIASDVSPERMEKIK